MKITFQHPPTGDETFNPQNPSHYPKGSGIYIYGLNLDIDGKLQFLPLYVGKHNSNVGNRVFEHYYQERMPGSSNKEIFDLTKLRTKNDAQVLYSAMQTYDSLNGKPKTKMCNKELIWFNNKVFFNAYILRETGKNLAVSQYLSGSGHLASLFPVYGDLDVICSKETAIINCINRLKNKIIDTKQMFNKNFYYVYANVPKNDKAKIGYYENSTKLALQMRGIHTTAMAGKDADSSIIDLRNIDDHLIEIQ